MIVIIHSGPEFASPVFREYVDSGTIREVLFGAQYIIADTPELQDTEIAVELKDNDRLSVTNHIVKPISSIQVKLEKL